MSTKSINDLIEQGYLITDADDKYSGEVWALQASLRSNFDDVFKEFRDGQSICENARIAKESAVARADKSRSAIEHSLAKLKQFIRAVADKEMAKDMFHTLGVDAQYPNKDADFITLLLSMVVPHLNDWDGTPQEIEADLKAEIQAGATEFADAVRDAEEAIANSINTTQNRDEWRDKYEDILTQIRNWLYLKLPDGKYDSRLDEYGFEVWEKPPVHKLYPPGAFKYDVKNREFSWKEVKAADEYEVQISKDEGENWETVAKTEETSAKVQLPQNKILARVRSIKKSDPYGESSWSDSIAIDARPPAVPQHLRWHEAEYHGDTFALIEWNAAARADTYELEYNPVGRDAEIIDVGDKLFKYEDIMGAPGTYKYRVRGKNDFGVGEWSNEITIVVE